MDYSDEHYIVILIMIAAFVAAVGVFLLDNSNMSDSDTVQTSVVTQGLYEQGYQDGFAVGYDEGYNTGKSDTAAAFDPDSPYEEYDDGLFSE